MIRQSLKTDRILVAKLRLADLEKEERRRVESRGAAATGKMTFSEAVGLFRERLKPDVHPKPRSKDYREERGGVLWKSWRGIPGRVAFTLIELLVVIAIIAGIQVATNSTTSTQTRIPAESGDSFPNQVPLPEHDHWSQPLRNVV